jgi:hypothetical protein
MHPDAGDEEKVVKVMKNIHSCFAEGRGNINRLEEAALRMTVVKFVS